MTIITKDNIDEIIKDGVTSITYSAVWCGPCRQLAPVIEQLETDFSNNDMVTITKCDLDDNQELAMEFGIRSVPTTIIFKDGEVVDTIMGVDSKTALTEKINSFI